MNTIYKEDNQTCLLETIVNNKSTSDYYVYNTDHFDLKANWWVVYDYFILYFLKEGRKYT